MVSRLLGQGVSGRRAVVDFVLPILLLLATTGVVLAFFQYADWYLEKSLRKAGCEDFTGTTPPEGTFKTANLSIGNVQMEGGFTVELFPEGVVIPLRRARLLIPYSRLKLIDSLFGMFEITGSPLRCTFGEPLDRIIASKLKDEARAAEREI